MGRGTWLVGLALIAGVLSGCSKKDCVLPSGKSFAHGTQVTCDDGCNACVCDNGSISSTTMGCVKAPAPAPTPPR